MKLRASAGCERQTGREALQTAVTGVVTLTVSDVDRCQSCAVCAVHCERLRGLN